MDSLKINNITIPVYEYETIVIGSGCGGFNAADSLYDFGKKNIALVTEGIKLGTSRNTGSDKQTYYKLSMVSGESDSVSEMANTLFSGKSVNGDTALAEAANSARAFIKLVNLGVPFPTNMYGEFVGYMTDHDKRKRATSAGPLTSKYMTEALEKSVNSKNIKIFDNTVVFKILTDNNHVIGAAAIDKKRINDENSGLVIFKASNIIMATGGHAMIYKNSVYPSCQTGMTGMALEAGAEGANLQEWQYGIASVDFRWNLSGTYQQVIPKYVSVDADGKEHEFLMDYFENPSDCVNYVFQKGYQWPFDSAKIKGSTVIDMIVYNEAVNLGRKIYMDFRTEPKPLENGFDALSDEARTYLKNSDALVKTPIARLEKMNHKAIELYKAHGIDLYKEPLKISVCAQHTNGGIAVDSNWETSVSGLYAVGELAGTFGVYRPGGTALNSTQVGSLRAAEHIAYKENTWKKYNNLEYHEIIAKNVSKILEKIGEIHKKPVDKLKNNDIIKTYKEEFSEKMSISASYIRNIGKMRELKKETKEFLENFDKYTGNVNIHELVPYLKLRDMLITQNAVLDAMILSAEKIGSRGGSFSSDKLPPLDSARDIFNIKLSENKDYENKILYTSYAECESKSVFRDIRPIPHCDNWFETVWNDYLKKRGL